MGFGQSVLCSAYCRSEDKLARAKELCTEELVQASCFLPFLAQHGSTMWLKAEEVGEEDAALLEVAQASILLVTNNWIPQ